MSDQRDKRRRASFLWPLLLLALAVIVIGVGLWLASRPAPPMIQGMVDADVVQVSAKVPGRLERLYAHEGDSVTAGQLLYVLSSPELDAKTEQVEAQRLAADAQALKAQNGARREDIDAAYASWQAAKANAELAEKTFIRMQNLYDEGVISLQKRDEAAAAAKATASTAAAAYAQYAKASTGTRPEDIVSAEAQAAQAAAGVREVGSLQEELSVVAPIDGEISRKNANIGEVVPPTLAVFSMFDPNDIWVAINVREDQFSSLSIGQELSGNVPALERDGLRFRVYYIAPLGSFATWRATRESSGFDVKTFEVRLRPINPPDALRPGMSVLFAWPPR